MLQQAFPEFARHVPKEALRGRFSDPFGSISRAQLAAHSVMKTAWYGRAVFRRFPAWCATWPSQCGKEGGLVLNARKPIWTRVWLDACRTMTHLVRNAVSPPHRERRARVRNRKASTRNHPSHFVSPRQSGYRGNHRRRCRIDRSKSQSQSPGERPRYLGGAERLGKLKFSHSCSARVSALRWITEISAAGRAGRSAERDAATEGPVEIETRVPEVRPSASSCHSRSPLSRPCCSGWSSVVCRP